MLVYTRGSHSSLTVISMPYSNVKFVHVQHTCVYAVQQKLAVLQALLTPLENYSAMVVQQHSINVGARHVKQTA